MRHGKAERFRSLEVDNQFVLGRRITWIVTMSALGRSRRLRHVRVTSALPPIATDARTFWIGSFVPQPDSCSAA
jgi:hypothetical protein